MKLIRRNALTGLATACLAALSVALGAATAVSGQAKPPVDVPPSEVEGVRSVRPAGLERLQADVQQTSTYIISSYVPFGRMVESRTHHLAGSFVGENYFYICSSFRHLTVSSTGAACHIDPGRASILCDEGLTSVAFSYNCTFTPATSFELVGMGYSYSSAYNLDRVADVYFSPLLFVSADLTPTLLEDGHLRWVQPNTPRLQAFVIYRDPRKTFVPIVWN